MASLSDTSAADSNQSFGRSVGLDMDNDSCGAGIDWSRGLRGLQRSTRQPSEISGSLLTRVIEGEVIPRLLLAHRNAPTAEPLFEAENLADIGTSEAFAELVLISEVPEIVERIEALLARGISLDRIFMDLLAPVARMLGVLWEDDRCTFTDVTIGVSRLHQVLHEISRRGLDDGHRAKVPRRAYFVPSPGEQHTFGLSMLEEFFLHAGWETACDHAASAQTVLATVAHQHLDIIGFSVGCKEFVEPLSDLIRRTRAASRNRDVAIMVGGRVFLDHPEIAAKFDTETVVTDGIRAVQIAETLISPTSRRGEAERADVQTRRAID